MVDLTDKQKYVHTLKVLNFSSFCCPTYPISGIQNYCEKVLVPDVSETDDDGLSDVLDDAGNGMAALLIYLYDKDFLTTEQLKKLVNGLHYDTASFGPFQDYARELGIVVNKK